MRSVDVVIYDEHFAWSPPFNAIHPVGGWECHMVQIAEWLAGRGLSVEVRNECVEHDFAFRGVRYNLSDRATHARALILGRHSTIPPWLTADRVVTSMVDDPRFCRETYDHLIGKSLLVCLSDWHARVCASMGHDATVIPSAIDDAVYSGVPPMTERSGFVCVNAWNKGTEATLAQWARMRARRPGWRSSLRVGSPYSHPSDAQQRCERMGASWLGTLSPAAVIDTLASAEAVFRVNDRHPETFGVTDALAEAVGCRVHALHKGEFGAAREVLVSPYVTQSTEEFEAGVWCPIQDYPCPPDYRASRVLPMWLPVLGME